MKYSSVYLLLASFFVCALSACAQTKKTTSIKSATSYARVIEATRIRTLPGAPGMQPTDEYRILIVWKSTQKPTDFFWRSSGNWFPCEIAKAQKTVHPAEGQRWYNVQEITVDKIKPGDTLELLPVAGGKFPIPQEIPTSAVNTLYLKTKKTSWLSLPVKNIKKQDEIMQ
jgi:hypothetical protein